MPYLSIQWIFVQGQNLGGTCPLSSTVSAGSEAFKPLLNSMDLFCCVHQAISLGMFYVSKRLLWRPVKRSTLYVFYV